MTLRRGVFAFLFFAFNIGFVIADDVEICGKVGSVETTGSEPDHFGGATVALAYMQMMNSKEMIEINDTPNLITVLSALNNERNIHLKIWRPMTQEEYEKAVREIGVTEAESLNTLASLQKAKLSYVENCP